MTKPESDDPGQRSIQSIEVGGRLLLALSRHDGPMTLKDLAASADLPPSRAHPYLVSFGRLRLVVQDAVTGRYALGPAALQVGLACLQQLDPIRIAMPVADALAEQTGYAIAVALWGNFGPTIVRVIEARQPLLVAIRAGTVMSVLGTATGRAFAAVLPEARIVEGLIGQPATPGETRGGRPRALTRAEEALIAEARADVLRHGVVRAEGHPIPGINAFSAPSLDHEGQPALVLTAMGHQGDLSVEWTSAAAAAVRQAARDVSDQLGWRGAAGRG